MANGPDPNGKGNCKAVQIILIRRKLNTGSIKDAQLIGIFQWVQDQSATVHFMVARVQGPYICLPLRGRAGDNTIITYTCKQKYGC